MVMILQLPGFVKAIGRGKSRLREKFRPGQKNLLTISRFHDRIYTQNAAHPPGTGKDQIAMNDELMDYQYYTLTDEEGNESEFELLATAELDGVTYYALVPAEETDNEYAEYVVLRREKDENGEDVLVTIEDDDEFDRVADYFDELLQSEIDYDAEAPQA